MRTMDTYGCKVCRVLDEHGLADREQDLLDRWVAEGPKRMGYRRLAKWLNVALLRRAMDRAGLSILGEEPVSKYERLTGDEEAVAEELRTDLSGAGVEVERIEQDFVSYGVIRTHLKECLGAERDHAASDWEADSIRIATDHAEEKVTEAIRSLSNKGDLRAGGEISVTVRVDLECEHCHMQVPAERALRRGHVCSEEQIAAEGGEQPPVDTVGEPGGENA